MSNTRQTRPARPNGADQRRISQLERRTGEPIEQLVADAEADAQAEFEGSPRPATIEFYGQRYRIADRVGYMPLLKFAHESAKGTDSGDMLGMAAMYEMLRGCFWRGEPCGECEPCQAGRPKRCENRADDDWPRFEQAAIDELADDSDLFTVVSEVIEVVTSRPTRARSGSPQPDASTSANSKARSRLPADADGLMSVDDLAH